MNASITKQNPLSTHFRTAALFLELPSRGENYPEGVLELDESGEVAIFPMTAKDQIAMHTPDALMSGSATAQVIQSCVPAIKNGFDIPTIDVDPILIAIRIASIGEEMDFTNVCPKCGEENTYQVDLKVILDKYEYVDFSESLELDGLKFFFKPQLFRQLNKLGIKTFNEQRALGVLDNDNLDDEEKLKQFNIYLKSVSATSVDISSGFIKSIVTESGEEVSDLKFIIEYLSNCDNKIYKQIENKIISFGEYTRTKPLQVTCAGCKESYTTAVEFEASNFFG